MGEFEVNGVLYNPVAVVGNCFQGQALGRCGAAAGPDPDIGYRQNFAKDCFDHDLCCGFVQGSVVCGPECTEEFWHASNDFYTAPDCASMKGSWYGGYDRFAFSSGDAGVGTTEFLGCSAFPLGCSSYSGDGNRNFIYVNLNFYTANPSPGCVSLAHINGAFVGCGQIPSSYYNNGFSSGQVTLFRGFPPIPPTTCIGVCQQPEPESRQP